MNESYRKEARDSNKRGAIKEHVERMEFLSDAPFDVEQRINKIVKSVSTSWFENRESRHIILNKMIQAGIQIAIDIQRYSK